MPSKALKNAILTHKFQMKATEQYFPVVLYTIQTFGSPLNETSMYYSYSNVTFLQDKICDFLNFSLGTLKFCYCVLSAKDHSRRTFTLFLLGASLHTR